MDPLRNGNRWIRLRYGLRPGRPRRRPWPAPGSPVAPSVTVSGSTALQAFDFRRPETRLQNRNGRSAGSGSGRERPRFLDGLCRPHLSGLVYASAGGRSRPHSLGERTESSDDTNLLRDSSDRSMKVEALSVFSSLQQQLAWFYYSYPFLLTILIYLKPAFYRAFHWSWSLVHGCVGGIIAFGATVLLAEMSGQTRSLCSRQRDWTEPPPGSSV